MHIPNLNIGVIILLYPDNIRPHHDNMVIGYILTLHTISSIINPLQVLILNLFAL